MPCAATAVSSSSIFTSPSNLKRKKPSRIDIPVMTCGFNDKGGTVQDFDTWSEVEVEGNGYSVFCKRNRRGGVMEDRFAALVDFQGNSKQAFFGVFDGHGGTAAAEFAAKNLANNIKIHVSNRSEAEIVEAVKEGYLTTDSDFLKKELRGGSCSVTAIVHNGDLIVSNAGDCRAVMSRGGAAEALTVDHKPSLDQERKRIQSLGGYVDCFNGVWRVDGSLAVSRAIGDSHVKNWVIAEPTTEVIKMNTECEFLVLASDGLWDKVGNQEAVDIVGSVCIGDKPEALVACKKLVDLSLERGCSDDISVMVILLTHFLQDE